MTGLRRIGLIAAVVATVPALMAGLAVAGATLPEPARSAADRVGLPNQASDAGARSVSVLDVVSRSEERGCEFGQAVADAASGGTAGSDQDPCSRGDEGGEASDQERGARGKGAEKRNDAATRGGERKGPPAERGDGATGPRSTSAGAQFGRDVSDAARSDARTSGDGSFGTWVSEQAKSRLGNGGGEASVQSQQDGGDTGESQGAGPTGTGAEQSAAGRETAGAASGGGRP